MQQQDWIEDTWLTLAQVMDYVKISKASIHRLLAEKKIPAYKVGRLWRFKKEELDQWIVSSEAKHG